ncbi:hypothetical protein RB601_002273 [Gaeumannomyces tritici]
MAGQAHTASNQNGMDRQFSDDNIRPAAVARGHTPSPAHSSLERDTPGAMAEEQAGSDSGGRRRAGDRWWKIHFFRGMINDVRQRLPHYASDWTDAWDYRVVPATIYMYFANILPALAFSLDMFTKTDMQFGVNEVLLSSVLGAVAFALLSCQPLVIVGVTGPITVFNYTVYDIMSPTGTNYLAFMCWIGIWSLVLHCVLAVTNSCNWLRYVTRFPCDVFGFYVACIYIQKGVEVLTRLGDREPFYLSVAVAVLVFGVAYLCGRLGDGALFSHPVRVFLKDYGTPLTVIFFAGFVHVGRMAAIPLEVLPTGPAFAPTTLRPRGWVVDFWNLGPAHVFLALPFAVLLTVLFWFDHNVSSLIAQGTEFPLRKPAGFHWDLFLLGLTTGVAGLLGLPFPNGLIPQAPFHTESLCVTALVPAAADGDESSGNEHQPPPATATATDHPTPAKPRRHVQRVTHVVEQRVSNLAQGLLTLGTMTPPLLAVLHLVPQAVLAGLFFVMGAQALAANGVTAKLAFLCRDAALTPPSHPLLRLHPRRGRRPAAVIWAFVAVELVAFAATFAVTQTVAAVAFPVFILALIPVRALLLPRWFEPAELAVLDGPAASALTMANIGGVYGATAAAAAGPGDGVLLDAVAGSTGGDDDDVEDGRRRAAGAASSAEPVEKTAVRQRPAGHGVVQE